MKKRDWFFAHNRFDRKMTKKYGHSFSHARFIHYKGKNYRVKPMEKWRYKVSKR